LFPEFMGACLSLGKSKKKSEEKKRKIRKCDLGRKGKMAINKSQRRARDEGELSLQGINKCSRIEHRQTVSEKSPKTLSLR